MMKGLSIGRSDRDVGVDRIEELLDAAIGRIVHATGRLEGL